MERSVYRSAYRCQIIIFVAGLIPLMYLCSEVVSGSQYADHEEAARNYPDPAFPWVLLKNGTIKSGRCVPITTEHVLFGETEENATRIPRSEVASVLWLPPIDPDITQDWLRRHLDFPPSESPQNQRSLSIDILILTNGDQIRCQVLDTHDRMIRFRLSGVNIPRSVRTFSWSFAPDKRPSLPDFDESDVGNFNRYQYIALREKIELERQTRLSRFWGFRRFAQEAPWLIFCAEHSKLLEIPIKKVRAVRFGKDQ